MLLGWITNERAKLSHPAQIYLDKLKEVVKPLQQLVTLVNTNADVMVYERD